MAGDTHSPQVVSTLCSVWQTTVRSRISGDTINATRTPGDMRAAHFLRKK